MSQLELDTLKTLKKEQLIDQLYQVNRTIETYLRRIDSISHENGALSESNSKLSYQFDSLLRKSKHDEREQREFMKIYKRNILFMREHIKFLETLRNPSNDNKIQKRIEEINMILSKSESFDSSDDQ